MFQFCWAFITASSLQASLPSYTPSQQTYRCYLHRMVPIFSFLLGALSCWCWHQNRSFASNPTDRVLFRRITEFHLLTWLPLKVKYLLHESRANSCNYGELREFDTTADYAIASRHPLWLPFGVHTPKDIWTASYVYGKSVLFGVLSYESFFSRNLVFPPHIRISEVLNWESHRAYLILPCLYYTFFAFRLDTCPFLRKDWSGLRPSLANPTIFFWSTLLNDALARQEQSRHNLLTSMSDFSGDMF